MSLNLDIPFDKVLGGLQSTLDPETVLQECRNGLNRIDVSVKAAWSHCRFVEAFYHPERYLKVAYALLNQPDLPTNRIWPEATLVYLHTPPRKPISARGVLLTINGVEVEAYCFPNDRRLRSVRKFQSRIDALTAWQEWLASNKDPFRIEELSLRRAMIRYVPEKRWVLRLRCRGIEANGAEGKRSIAVRCTTSEQCRSIAERHNLIAQAARSVIDLSVPEIVGCDTERGIIATEWLRGDDLFSQLSSTSSGELIESAVKATVAFHRLPVNLNSVCTHSSIISMLEVAIADILLVSPDFEDELHLLRDRCTSNLLASPQFSTNVLLHNDLHPQQFRVKGDDISILDLDRICRGDPVVDVANFMVQVEAMADREDCNLEPEAANQLSQRFLDRYEQLSQSRLNDSHLWICSAAASLNLARGMMRHLRPNWRSFLDRRVRKAVEYSDRVCSTYSCTKPTGAQL